ncbi:MAG: 50S ribosomal protein L29 [Candidatus Paceibacterota bacterium]|jgi:ribosomal protein L29
MKIKDIKTKTIPDLMKLRAEKHEALRVFRFGTAGAKSKNVKEAKTIKKDIARIETILTASRKSA